MQVELIVAVLIAVAALAVGAVASGFICFKKGIKHRIKTAEAQFESAEKESARIIQEAGEKAEAMKKTALVEAKDEIYALRTDAEKEINRLKADTEKELKERRGEVSRSERRIAQKEENLDKKNDTLEKKDEQLQKKLKAADEKLEEADKIKHSQMEILEKITDGRGTLEDIDELESLASYIKDNSLCGLGQTAPNPVLATLRFFRDEYIAHVVDKKCPAGVCKKLLKIEIDPEKCRGCTLCARKCPVGAISGTVKNPHTIDASKCVKCGVCMDSCKFGAISKK